MTVTQGWLEYRQSMSVLKVPRHSALGSTWSQKCRFPSFAEPDLPCDRA